MTNENQRTHYVDGWSISKGPIATLHKVGLWPDPRETPTWLRTARTAPDQYGRDSYFGSAAYLSDVAIRSLAALTLEGWHVMINGQHPRGVEFKITPAEKRSA